MIITTQKEIDKILDEEKALIDAENELRQLDSWKETWEGNPAANQSFYDKKKAEILLQMKQLKKDGTDTEQPPLDLPAEKTPPKELSKIRKIENYLNYKYDFRKNEITDSIEYRTKNTADEYVRMEEENYNDILFELSDLEFKAPEKQLDIILNSSRVTKYNEIREYFREQAFTPSKIGTIQRLADCIVLDDLDINIEGRDYRQLFNDYFRKWLIACYYCSTGINHNDIMFILIGAQGRFKTSFLNNLTPLPLKQYAVTGHINPQPGDYNTLQFLAEKMFINIDDQMETIVNKDYNLLKAIISADTATLRQKYAKRTKTRKRIANFCGSVNESRFLRDSNNRRYLCFKIKDIKPEYSDVNINDLWAEVRYMAQQEQQYYVFTQQDFKNIDIMNAYFEAPSEEAEALQSIFRPAEPRKKDTYGPDQYFVQFSEILQICKIYTNNNNLRPYNLQTAMRKYGYVSHCCRQPRFDNRPVYLYCVELVTAKQYIIDKCYQDFK